MRVLAAALTGVIVAVLPTTAALAADPKPDIAVTSAADKATYAEGGTFTITVTVKNNGSVDATNVHYNGGDSEGVEGVVYGELSTGFDLAAGATRTFQLTGRTDHRAWRYGHGYVAFELVADNGEADDADNITVARLVVPGAFAPVGGHVFQGDSYDAPGTPQTPGVPGVTVVATSTDRATKYGEAVTDDQGRFRIARVPAGEVLLTFTAPAGWKILVGESEDDHTLAQVIAEDGEALVSVPAKRVAVSSPSASASPVAGPGLPVTGDNTTLLAGAGAVAVAIGVVLALVARRRRLHLQA